MGTVNVLEAARACPSVRAVVIVTSDKCYENHETGQAFRETDRDGRPRSVQREQGVRRARHRRLPGQLLRARAPRWPRSGPATSSAAATGRPTGSSRTCVRALAAGRADRGPEPRRDPALAARAGAAVGLPPAGRAAARRRRPRYAGAWNFGPDGRRAAIGPCAGSSSASSRHGARAPGPRRPVTAAQPHEAHRLSLDSTKARERLGWAPVWDAQTAVRRTAEWYREYYRAPARARELVEDHLHAYQADARAAGLPWAASEESRPRDGCRATTPQTPAPRSWSSSAATTASATRRSRSIPSATPCATRAACSARRSSRLLVDVEPRLLPDGRPVHRAVRGRRSRTISGCSDALFVNSGSSANLVALAALTSPKLGDRRLQPGDEVITVAAGFPSTVAPIVQNGLVPVFVDVRLDDYNADPDELRAAVSPRTRAIMLAHTLGVPFDLDTVMDLVDEARPVAGRGQLRRPRLALSRPAHGHLRPPGHLVLLPGPPHHDRRGRHGRDRRRGAGPDRALDPRLGPRLLLRGRREQHLRQALRPAVRQPALRLRPQVRLQPPRLQPEGHGHAGGHRRRPAGPARRVRRRPQAQPRPAARGAPPVRGPAAAAGGAAAHRSVLVRVRDHRPRGRRVHPATS